APRYRRRSRRTASGTPRHRPRTTSRPPPWPARSESSSMAACRAEGLKGRDVHSYFGAEAHHIARHAHPLPVMWFGVIADCIEQAECEFAAASWWRSGLCRCEARRSNFGLGLRRRRALPWALRRRRASSWIGLLGILQLL